MTVDNGAVENPADGGDSSDSTDALSVPPDADLVGRTPTVAQADVRVPQSAESADRVSSILVAVAGGPHSGATVDFARALAEETDSLLELFHVLTVHSGDDEDEDGKIGAADALLDSAERRLGSFDRVDRWVVEDETAADAIVEQSSYYDVVVIGASTSGRVEQFVHGSTTGTVVNDAVCPVVVVTAEGTTHLLADAEE